jgi:hypothetical protein
MLREVHLQLVRLAGVEGAWRSSHIDDPPLVLFHPPLFFIYVFLSFRIKNYYKIITKISLEKKTEKSAENFTATNPKRTQRVLDQFGGG